VVGRGNRVNLKEDLGQSKIDQLLFAAITDSRRDHPKKGGRERMMDVISRAVREKKNPAKEKKSRAGGNAHFQAASERRVSYPA